MAINVNEDQDGDVIYSAEDLEAYFPGCVIRHDGCFTMNHNRLTIRYIMAVKATTDLSRKEFLKIMERHWDNCEVDRCDAQRVQ